MRKLLKHTKKTFGLTLAAPFIAAFFLFGFALSLLLCLLTDPNFILSIKKMLAYGFYGGAIGGLIGSGVRHIFYNSQPNVSSFDTDIVLNSEQKDELKEFMAKVDDSAAIQVDLVANPAGHVSPQLKGMAGHHAAINIKVGESYLKPIEIGGDGKYYRFPSQEQKLHFNKNELELLYKCHIFLRDQQYSNLVKVYAPGTNDCVTYIDKLIRLFNQNQGDGEFIESNIGRFDRENDSRFAKLSHFALSLFRGSFKDKDGFGKDKSAAGVKPLHKKLNDLNLEDEQVNEAISLLVGDYKRKYKAFKLRFVAFTAILSGLTMGYYNINLLSSFLDPYVNSNLLLLILISLFTYLFILNSGQFIYNSFKANFDPSTLNASQVKYLSTATKHRLNQLLLGEPSSLDTLVTWLHSITDEDKIGVINLLKKDKSQKAKGIGKWCMILIGCITLTMFGSVLLDLNFNSSTIVFGIIIGFSCLLLLNAAKLIKCATLNTDPSTLKSSQIRCLSNETKQKLKSLQDITENDLEKKPDTGIDFSQSPGIINWYLRE